MANDFNLIVNTCKDLLSSFPSAEPYKSYLSNRLSKTISDKFEFGYFPDHTNLNLILNSIDENKLAKLNLIYDHMHDNNRERHGSLENHNLVMPYKDVYGNILALVGRTIISEERRQELNIPKYKNTAFSKGEHLFGLYEARKAILNTNIVYVVEGQLCVCKAHEHGIENVVALGGSNMSFIQLALLKRYAERIILMLDNDAAGQAGMEKALFYFGKYARMTKRNFPNGYKDLDEFLGAGNHITDL